MSLPGVETVAGGLKGSGGAPPGPDASELSASLGYLKAEDIAQIERAYETARAAHASQYRKSGEPYITHPLAVAKILAEWHLDPQALMSANGSPAGCVSTLAQRVVTARSSPAWRRRALR